MSRRGWILLAVLAALMAAAYGFGVADLLSIEAVQERRAELLSAVEARPLLAAAAFMLAYAAVVALSLPAASIMTLLGGFLFGTLLGGTLAVLAATVGATVVFLVARSSFGGALRARAGPLAGRVSQNIRGNAFEYLLALRVAPVFPFFVVNILPALFDVRLRTFVLATLIGIIPGTFVYAYLGRELGTISGLDDLLSTKILLAFGLLGLIALLPVGYRKWKEARSRPNAPVALLFLAAAACLGQAGGETHAANPPRTRPVEAECSTLHAEARPMAGVEIALSAGRAAA
jgi:uncharacterized membrane protein YdjX (TVP38/TMEM64 family)